jgi:hypothetical protein
MRKLIYIWSIIADSQGVCQISPNIVLLYSVIICDNSVIIVLFYDITLV